MQSNEPFASSSRYQHVKTSAPRSILAYALYEASQSDKHDSPHDSKHQATEQHKNNDTDDIEEPCEAEYPGETSRKRRKLTTGCESIDRDALLGGLEYGNDGIVCLSVNAGEGGLADGRSIGRDLAITFLATHLCEDPAAPAFYIDCAGDFSPRDLQKALREKIMVAQKPPDFVHHGGHIYEPAQRSNESGAEQRDMDDSAIDHQVEAAMVRVSVMRVFDIVGALDAVSEISTLLESKDSPPRQLSVPTQDDNSRPPLALTRKDEVQEDTNIEIADSEAGSDEDFLDHTLPSPQRIRPLGLFLEQNNTEVHAMQSEDTATVNSPLLIFSNLPRLISPIINSSQTQGQAMLSHLVRSLRHFCRTHDAIALLLNSTVSDADTERKQYDTQGNCSTTAEEIGTSIFSAAGSARPALGKTLPFLTDVSLLVSKVTMPMSNDTRGPGSNVDGDRLSTEVLVLEVLVDRVGRRAGRWGMFSLP